VNPNTSALGERFKQEREKRGLTTGEICQQLHMHPDILERIERSEFHEWPGGTIYAKGFVRQYANFLGFNTAEIMNELDVMGVEPDKVELTIESRIQKPSILNQYRVVWEPLKQNRKAISKVLAVAVCAILLFAVMKSMVQGIGSWIESRNTAKEQTVSKRVAPPPPVRTPVRTPSVVKTAPNPAPPATRTRTNYLNSPAAANYPTISSSDPLMLEIMATTDVWMRVVADDQVLFESILKQGETERWIADRMIELKLGRPEGVQLSLNGFHMGKPGDGHARHVVLTRDGMVQIQ